MHCPGSKTLSSSKIVTPSSGDETTIILALWLKHVQPTTDRTQIVCITRQLGQSSQMQCFCTSQMAQEGFCRLAHVGIESRGPVSSNPTLPRPGCSPPGLQPLPSGEVDHAKKNSSAQSLCCSIRIKSDVWLIIPYTLNLMSLWEMDF